jgi:hypothetical protein
MNNCVEGQAFGARKHGGSFDIMTMPFLLDFR